MSAPILYGSPRAQKNYITPRYEGISTRKTTSGYNQDRSGSVERYVIPPPPPSIDDLFQGNSYGYVIGGNYETSPGVQAAPTFSDFKVKYSLVNDTPSVPSPGNLTKGVLDNHGHSSGTEGFVSAGRNNSPFPPTVNDIWKFPFASEEVSAVGALDTVSSLYGHGGVSAVPTGYGYTLAGTYYPTTPPINNFAWDDILKFSFVTGTASTVGTIIGGAVPGAAGLNSSENGYRVGGQNGRNEVDKFPFANDTNIAQVATTIVSNLRATANSSQTDGYILDGTILFPSNPAAIMKLPFSSDTPAVNVGDAIDATRFDAAPASGLSNGYSAGGYQPGASPIFLDKISKHNYGSSVTYSDVAALGLKTANAAGTQS